LLALINSVLLQGNKTRKKVQRYLNTVTDKLIKQKRFDYNKS